MFNNILSNGVFNNLTGIISIISAIVCGLVISFTYKKTSLTTQNFIICLFLLPLLVSIAIMLVNGNLGIGVAIVGVFGLVRFRSIPGTAKEIISVFLAMVIGLSIGTGYLYLGIGLTILVSLILFVLNLIKDDIEYNKELRVIVPEDVEFNKEFNDIFDKYLDKYSMDKVKTANMGSLYEITYSVTLKKDIDEKDFIDDLRIRNGNLKIILYKKDLEKEAL